MSSRPRHHRATCPLRSYAARTLYYRRLRSRDGLLRWRHRLRQRHVRLPTELHPPCRHDGLGCPAVRQGLQVISAGVLRLRQRYNVYGLRAEGLVLQIGAVVCLSRCATGPIVRCRGQWMAAYRAAVPLAHANQLPLPRLQSAAVLESHVSSAISSSLLKTFTLIWATVLSLFGFRYSSASLFRLVMRG